MNWKLKSMVQRACATLPFAREDLYYGLQKTFGRSRTHEPLEYFREAAEMAAQLAGAGRPLEGARVMEVGTGRGLDLPIGLYLCGAAHLVTVDLHRYLRPERVAETLAFLRANPATVRAVLADFAGAAVVDERLAELARLTTAADLFRTLPIVYRAPADAAHLDLPAGSIDVQVSFTVFEHIPAAALVGILTEAGRLLAPAGVALHHVDMSDHFSHDDPAISAINFLQFSEREWTGYAGNQFAYHNRLRAPDYRAIYARSGHEILGWRPYLDEGARRALAEGLPLAPQFRRMSPEDLCVSQIRILSRPTRRG